MGNSRLRRNVARFTSGNTLDLVGVIEPVPGDGRRLPWDGPTVRIVEHTAHAPGHAALLIEQAGVLVAGDMLSDVEIPLLDIGAPDDPLRDYERGLQLLTRLAGEAAVLPREHEEQLQAVRTASG